MTAPRGCLLRGEEGAGSPTRERVLPAAPGQPLRAPLPPPKRRACAAATGLAQRHAHPRLLAQRGVSVCPRSAHPLGHGG